MLKTLAKRHNKVYTGYTNKANGQAREKRRDLFLSGLKKKQGFAPNNIFYKSPTSIGLENLESTQNKKKKAQKNGFQTRKLKTQMSSMHALIPIDEILNDIGSHVLKHFIYCHLMHALMSTCDPMSFKISSIGIRACRDDI